MTGTEREEWIRQAYNLGYEMEKKWGNCAQVTLWAIQQTLSEAGNAATHLDPGELKAISGFHAGAGGLCDGACGGYVAGIYMISRKFGRAVEQLGADSEDPRAVRTTRGLNHVVAQLHRRFIEEYGTVVCSGIHRRLYGRTFHLLDEDDRKKFDAAGAHEWGCTAVVGNATQWSVDILLSDGPETEEAISPAGAR